MSATQPESNSPDIGNNDLLLRVLKALQRGETRPLASLLLAHRHALASVCECLVEERLAVYACAVLRESRLFPLFPRAAWGSMEDQWRRQQQRNVEVLHALAQLDRGFREAGIEYRLLKGLYLGARFYGGLDRRFTWDIDLMVHREDIWAALDLLGRLGFTKPKFSLGLERLAPWVSHALECRRADGHSVDLHWGFRRLPGLRIDDAAVWQAGRSCEVAGLRCPVLSDEQSLLQLLLGVAADTDRGLCRMRSIWDVYMVLRHLADHDWRGFLDQCEAQGSVRLVANAFALVLYRLDCHAEFPALAQALEPYRDRLSVHTTEQTRTILGRAPHGLSNRLLYAGWQPPPQWRYWSWWAATLPLRFFFARRL